MPGAHPGSEFSDLVISERRNRMQLSTPRPSIRRGNARIIIPVICLALVVAGAFAYRHFFSRGSASVIQLIPADAAMIFTLDTNPSPSQVPTFKRIYDAIQKENLGSEIDSMMEQAMKNDPAAKELRPLVTNSYAMAMWMPEGGYPTGTPDVLGYMGMSDPGKANSILAKYGQSSTEGSLTYYRLGDGNVAIIDGYLVTATKPDLLVKVNSLSSGQGQALDKVPAFQSARASLPGDSN